MITNKIKVYLKSEIKEMIIALVVFVVICSSFAIYLKFVGIPMSKSHNLYNDASMALKRGDKDKALKLIDESLHYWQNENALHLKDDINNSH